jgi:hypothetical protein
MRIRKRGVADAQRQLDVLGYEAGCPALVAAARLRELVDDLELQAVDEMRAVGASWAAIGSCLDVTRQAAEKRWGGRS